VAAILSWNTSTRKDLVFPGDMLLIWIDSD
jgi:hypothetical protein